MKFLTPDVMQRAVNGRLTAEDFRNIQSNGQMDLADRMEEFAFHAMWDDELRDLMHSGKRFIGGGSRENDIAIMLTVHAAASAGATSKYNGVPAYRGGTMGGYQWRGFFWLYETTEANADNTLDFVLDYGVLATFVALHTNANAVGLLDTGAILTPFTNIGNAGSAAGAGVAVTPVVAKVPVNNVIRHTLTTGGTGTVPAIQMGSYGVFL